MRGGPCRAPSSPPAPSITVLYIVGTLSVLLAIPKEAGLGASGDHAGDSGDDGEAGVPWLAPLVAALVTLNALGGVGGWFAATARLPFVAGIDRFLPPAFGELHPRWRTPYVALLVQAVIAGVFVFLGQAGTSVRGAYDVLVSMGIIAYFIPFLFMFAAMIVLQREPAGPEVMRVPGGPGRDRAGRARLLRHGDVDRAGVRSGGRGAEQDARGREGGRLVCWRSSGSASSCMLSGEDVGQWPFMKTVPRLLLVLLVNAATASPARAHGTMRVDYYHTGNANEERFSLDRVVIEPLPWPGNPAQPIDTTNRGKYFFEVVDAASGSVLYSRGFSSIYGEWETTGEAKTMNRTFSESLRFPAPARRSASWSRSATPRTSSATSGRFNVDPADKFIARGRRRRMPAADQAARERRSREEARLADSGRRLHRARARQVRARRAPADRRRCSPPRRSRNGSRHQRLGPRLRRPRSRASRGRRSTSTAGRRSAPPTTRSTPSATC